MSRPRRHPRATAVRWFVRPALALLLLVPAAAVAAEPVETPPPAWGAPGEGAGAVAWWLLLGLSAVALAIVFEGLIAIRRGRIAPPSTAEALAGAVRSRSLDQATASSATTRRTTRC